MAGFSKGNLALTLGVSFGLLFCVLLVIRFYQKSHTVPQLPIVDNGDEKKVGIEMVEIEEKDKKPEDNEVVDLDVEEIRVSNISS